MEKVSGDIFHGISLVGALFSCERAEEVCRGDNCRGISGYEAGIGCELRGRAGLVSGSASHWQGLPLGIALGIYNVVRFLRDILLSNL